jgi:hypothetical protein
VDNSPAEPAAEAEAADTAGDKAAASKAAAEDKPASAAAEDKPASEGKSATEAAAAEDKPAAGEDESAAAKDKPGADVTESAADKPAAEDKPVKDELAAKPASTTAAGKAKPAAKAKPRTAKAKPVIDEPLMAELEKAPPAPEEPVMPTMREAAAARARAGRRFEEPPPRTLRISFYFFLLSGLVWLISMVASVILKQSLIDAEIKRNQNPDLTPEMIANGVTQILWIVLVASLTFAVFLGLFGYKATEGTRRARTLVTIFSVVLVLFHLLLNGTPAGILSAMCALVGLALLWSPSARAYFPPRQLT